MAKLTKNWQEIDYSTFTSGSFSVRFYLEAKYSSQSITNNSTQVQTRLRSEVLKGSGSGTGYKFTCTYCDERSGSGKWTFEDEVIIDGSNTVIHNSDGNKSIYLEATAYNKWFGFNKKLSATVEIPKIDRLATINNATDFTDETTPTVTFSNPGGFITKPYINIYDDKDVLVYQFYRNQDVSSPYIWTFTDAEKTAMRKACNKQSKYRCNVGVDTYNGSTKLGFNSVAKTMTIVNAEPSATYTLTEENAKVSALITSVSSIVENASQIKVSVTPSALKGATIKNVILTNGANEISKNSSPYEYTFDIQSSNVFKIKVIDSRNNAKEYIITKTLINYQPVAINSFKFKREDPTSSNIYLTADITYYQATFGTTANAPTIKYKMSESGTLRTLTTSDYTLDNTNHKITITNKKLTDTLPYNQEKIFFIDIEDKLSKKEDQQNIIRGIPTFDAGEHDFQVNGNLLVADTNRQNPVNILDAIFYKSGDTLQIPSMQAIIPGAYITSGKTEIYFNIYTPKLMTNINKITVTNLQLTARQNGGYILGSGDGGVTVNVTTAKATDNCVRCIYKASSAISNATNNAPVGLVISGGTLTFTKQRVQSDEEVSDLETI